MIGAVAKAVSGRTSPWATFAALSLLYFLASAGTFSSLGVVLPAMVRELGWNWTQAGLGFSLLGIACGLSSLVAASLIRRIGVRFTLLAGATLLVIGFAALAVTRDVYVYLGATLVIGVAFTLTTTVPGTHVLTNLFQKRSTVVGAYFTLGALGGVAGPLLYNALAPAAGWRAYWWVFAASALALGLFGAATTGGDRFGADDATSNLPDADIGSWTVRRALATPQFYIVVCAYTMYLLINTTAHGFAVEHLIERGIPAKAGAEMLSLQALIAAIVAVIGGWAGEKVSAKTLLALALAALVIGMTALAEARGYPLMVLYAVGVGIGYGLAFVASTMLLITYFGRSAYLELYSIMCLLSTAAALGPALGGWTRDTVGGFTGVFLVCAGAGFIMLIATILMRAPDRRDAVAELSRS